MKNSALPILMLFSMACVAQVDKCKSWTHEDYPVTMEACSYADGGSGYYKIKNNGDTSAEICWSLVFNSGKGDHSCNSNLQSGETTSGSCFNCGIKNDGAKYINLEKYEPK